MRFKASSIGLTYFLHILNGIGEIHCVNGIIMLINEGKSLMGVQIVERLPFSKAELVCEHLHENHEVVQLFILFS